MRKIACDGCGKSVPQSNKDDVKLVRLQIVNDERESFPEAIERLEADLCATCRGQLKAWCFGVVAEGRLELPAFIHSTQAERERAAAAG